MREREREKTFQKKGEKNIPKQKNKQKGHLPHKVHFRIDQLLLDLPPSST
jgi:hypothetical protein